MKKKAVFAAWIITGILLGLTACGTTEESEQMEQSSTQESIESQTITTAETEADSDSERCEKEFGSYIVPQGWVEADAFSSKDKFFYVREGEEEAEAPDNISINIGKNRYAAQDHLEFRKAIMAQLLRQTGGAEGVSVTGTGSQTNNGDILYQFTITEEESGIVTTQYYIVGEYQFCLIHETNFTQSEEVDEAAKEIVNSFVWGDD